MAMGSHVLYRATAHDDWVLSPGLNRDQKFRYPGSELAAEIMQSRTGSGNFYKIPVPDNESFSDQGRQDRVDPLRGQAKIPVKVRSKRTSVPDQV